MKTTLNQNQKRIQEINLLLSREDDWNKRKVLRDELTNIIKYLWTQKLKSKITEQ